MRRIPLEYRILKIAASQHGGLVLNDQARFSETIPAAILLNVGILANGIRDDSRPGLLHGRRVAPMLKLFQCNMAMLAGRNTAMPANPVRQLFETTEDVSIARHLESNGSARRESRIGWNLTGSMRWILEQSGFSMLTRFREVQQDGYAVTGSIRFRCGQIQVRQLLREASAKTP